MLDAAWRRALIATSLLGVAACGEGPGPCEGGSVELPFSRVAVELPDPSASTKGNGDPVRFDFESGSLAGLTSIETADAEHLGLVERGEVGNTRALFVAVTCDQPLVNGGMRSEITFDNQDPEGSTRWYAWSFFIPEDFRLPADYGADSLPWMVVGQWHDQPDVAKGETWDTFESRSPPVSFGFGALDGQFGMTLVYGDADGEVESSSPFFFELAAWHRLVTRIHWSRGNDGEAEAFLDGQSVATMTGPNMNNAAPHFFKLGLYRDAGIRTNNVLAFDDVRIGPTREDVE